MNKEYEAYLAYRKGLHIIPVYKRNQVYTDYLIHYGVKGQKWGHRQWQNADGTYTEAGKHRYGWGYGRQSSGTSAGTGGTMRAARPRSYQATTRRTASARPVQNQTSQADIEARKARTRKILGIAAGVAVVAAVSYAAYKGSTKLRDTMRSDVYKNFNTDARNVRTMNSKYWDAADRKRYSELSKQRADDVAKSITRRDAAAAKFAQKTGIQISVPQSRQKVMAQRRSENQYANFIRDAEKRGAQNRAIHDARADLRSAREKLSKYQNTERMGTSKAYESFWTQKHEESVKAAQERLNNLLQKRRAG